MSLILSRIKPSISVEFEKRDVWVGVYWSYQQSIESAFRRLTIIVCILPMLPIRFEWAWGWR